MLEQATEHVKAAGLLPRVEQFNGRVELLSTVRTFDAPTLIGMLHHIPSDEGKHNLLRYLDARLRPGRTARHRLSDCGGLPLPG